jgi:RNA polymerase sigma factor (sigma-70 family)
MRNHPSVTDLVTRARTGDKQAWDALVERYAPLVWSICARYQLAPADAAGASQSVWLHLAEQLANLHDPVTVAGWLATTTRRECARVARAAYGPHAVAGVPDSGTIPDDLAVTAEQELLDAERHAALRAAFAHLPPLCQQLLALLTADPPMPYAQISATLGIPVGSIGPLRGRCVYQLRTNPDLAAIINADTAPAPDQPRSQAGTPR